MTASTSHALVILEPVCEGHHFGIGEHWGVDSVMSARVRHCLVNVAVLALRLMGNGKFTPARQMCHFRS